MLTVFKAYRHIIFMSLSFDGESVPLTTFAGYRSDAKAVTDFMKERGLEKYSVDCRPTGFKPPLSERFVRVVRKLFYGTPYEDLSYVTVWVPNNHVDLGEYRAIEDFAKSLEKPHPLHRDVAKIRAARASGDFYSL